MQPTPIPPIPEETARVARAVYPKGNLYMKLRDEFGAFFDDESFADLYPQKGKPAETPWRLALVTLFQFLEGLTDRQAADAMSGQIDWKYALSMELDEPGCDYSVLCEFRARLVDGNAEDRLFEAVLNRFQERGLLRSRGRQRTDSTHLLQAVRGLTRTELVGETLRAALNALAETAPEWLASIAPSEWFDRYGRRMEQYRLPKGEKEREAWARQTGADGCRLLAALGTAPASAAALDAVAILRRVWIQQFRLQDDQVIVRSKEERPPSAQTIRSPYDPEARASKKRETVWTGYMVDLTESCDDDGTPDLVTQVMTTEATTSDHAALKEIHAALAEKERLPGEHWVDEGYTDAEVLTTSREEYGVEVLGPVAEDRSWQASEGKGYDITGFTIDWEKETATCPEGRSSRAFRASKDEREKEIWLVAFASEDCRTCPSRPQCTRNASRGRTLTLRPQREHEALQQARERQKTEAFHRAYAVRAGMEGTLSQGVRRFGLRRSRYVGQAKTHFQNLMIATAMNLCRVYDWLTDKPRARTRESSLARLGGQGSALAF